MTNEPSSRPWRVNSVTGGHISDANGNPVCFCVGRNCAERAQFIVGAVNERDRLRDIVRRLLAIAEPAVSELKELDAALLSVGCASVLPVAAKEAIIREARAALGEDKQ